MVSITPAFIAGIAASDASLLQQLSVARHGVSSLGELSALCPGLTRLDASHNRLLSLPASAAPALPPALSWLSLAHNQLDCIDAVAALRGLHLLNAAHNLLPALPPALADLRALRALVLNHNRLRLLPAPMRLPQLNTLVLSHNMLTEAKGLAGLTSLRKLSISNNKLGSFPDLTGLNALTDLRLNHNRIVSLPNSLIFLPHLKLLDLGNNLLPDFRTINVLKDLLNLNNINLAGNPVAKLPDYKDHVRSLIPQLQVHDGKLIDKKKQERKQKMRAVRIKKNMLSNKDKKDLKNKIPKAPLKTGSKGQDDAQPHQPASEADANPTDKSSAKTKADRSHGKTKKPTLAGKESATDQSAEAPNTSERPAALRQKPKAPARNLHDAGCADSHVATKPAAAGAAVAASPSHNPAKNSRAGTDAPPPKKHAAKPSSSPAPTASQLGKEGGATPTKKRQRDKEAPAAAATDVHEPEDSTAERAPKKKMKEAKGAQTGLLKVTVPKTTKLASNFSVDDLKADMDIGSGLGPGWN